MEGATLHRNQQTKTVFKGKDEKLREQRWRTLSRQKQSPHEEPTPFPHRLAAAKAVRRLQEGSVERERREVLTVCKQPLFPSSQRALEASLAPHASFAEMVISWDLKSDCCVWIPTSPPTSCMTLDKSPDLSVYPASSLIKWVQNCPHTLRLLGGLNKLVHRWHLELFLAHNESSVNPGSYFYLIGLLRGWGRLHAWHVVNNQCSPLLCICIYYLSFTGLVNVYIRSQVKPFGRVVDRYLSWVNPATKILIHREGNWESPTALYHPPWRGCSKQRFISESLQCDPLMGD